MSQRRPRLARTRRSAGLTQEELAYRLGVDRSTVGRWETGQTEPSAWLRTKIAKLLGVTRAELSTLLECQPTIEPASAPELSGGPNCDEQIYLATALQDFPGVGEQALVTSVLGPSRTLAVLDEFTRMIIPRYELEGPHCLAPETRNLRHLCQQLSAQVSGTDERLTLARFELVEVQDVPGGMTPCIDFAPYGWARTAANAATAYLSVGDYSQTQHLTRELSSVVAASDSDWSRSLVRLDEASALTLGRQADLEHAAALGMDALAASASKPIASVGRRAAELAADLRHRGKQRAGQEFAASLHEWNQRASEMCG